MTGLWIRWSLRDLRRRWLQVGAIAVVIAIGTGTYAGLNASTRWRRVSYDASYRVTHAHDLLVTLAQNTWVDEAALLAAVTSTPHPEWFEASTASLALPLQVEVGRDGETILVPGRLVGIHVGATDTGAEIDTVAVARGRGLTAADDGAPVVVMDEGFATARDLGATGTLTVSGDQEMTWVGTGQSPRYFVAGAGTATSFGPRGFAVLFTSLTTAQAQSGAAGQVNELAVRLAPGVDRARARAELEATLATALPTAAAEIELLEAEDGYRLLYDDIDNDRKVMSVFSLMILAGAAFAAFNLSGRIVEAQRREIGIGMSLGVERRWLALRPLLLAAEVAVMGATVGIGFGLLVGDAIGGVTQSYFPLPVWRRPFQLTSYLQATGLAIVMVVAASVLPVWRAVRVAPVDAITTGPNRRSTGGWAPLVRRLRVPGSTVTTLPFRDAVRRPRRTLFTALGIAAAVATLVGVFGMLDSIYLTIDEGEAELLRVSPDRIEVSMQGFHLPDSETIRAVTSAPGVADSSTGLRIGGIVAPLGVDLSNSDPLSDTGGDAQGDRFSVQLDMIDLESAVWTPSVTAGSLASTEPALVLSNTALDSLGAAVGDVVQFRHPEREGAGYRWVTTEMPIGAVHPNPYRFIAFMDVRHASLMNLAGIVNQVDVNPRPGTDLTQLQRRLFSIDGVGSVTPATEAVTTIRETMAEFLGILQVIVWVVLLLAVMIAFNSSSISADERRREHATMFAFGVPTRTVLGLAVAESAIVGVIATALGLLAGSGLTWWLVQRLFPDTLPDLGLTTNISLGTVLLAAALGVVAVSAAPVFILRSLRRMDIPATLRVVE